MSNRYADDIRRIVGVDPNRSTLGDPERKGSIVARRGIGYVNSNSGDAKGISGTPGTTQLSADQGQGDSSTGENAAGEVGLTPGDPQSGVIQSDTNTLSAEDIIDGNVNAAKPGSPQVTAAGLQYFNNGAANGMTAKDCDTGKDIGIRLRNDFVPPEGWENADTPPAAFQWELGYNYHFLDPNTGAGVGSDNGTTAYECASTAGNVWGGSMTEAYQSVSAGSHNGYGDFIGTYDPAIMSPVLYATYGNIFPVKKAACVAGTDTFCPLTEPEGAGDWPADNTYMLKLVDGQFVTSNRDEDVPAKFKNPVSRVDFCFGSGGSRAGTIEVTKDGGHMVYETSGGNPTGIIRVYDSSGGMVAAFDNQSGWIDNFRPVTP